MKKTILMASIVATMVGCGVFRFEKPVVVHADSPDGRNEIRLWTDPLAYEVVRDGVVVVAKSEIGLKVDGKRLLPSTKYKVRKEVKSGFVAMPVYKKARIDLSGNETFVDFGDWGVRLAARNDGVAYRFETRMPRRIRIDRETASVTIPDGEATCWVNFTDACGCEETTNVTLKAKEIVTDATGAAGGNGQRRFAYLPLAYSVDGKVVLVTESDVFDYPIWNFVRERENGPVRLDADFAKWPTAFRNNSRIARAEGGRRERHWHVAKNADYLVETDGARTFPWRTFVLADRPMTLIENDIVAALARQQVAGDFSWVKPGKVAWDWWNCWDNKGEEAFCTTAGYKQFVDFAAENGVEYVIMDEGWSEKLDIWKFSPKVDVPEVIRYGKERGVGIILWMAWAQIEGDEARVAEHFSKLGAVGFKVDFMDRGDASCERFLWTFAEECRKNRMMIDYHGVHRPTGLSRAYPNVLNYEGIHGLEQMKFFKGQDILRNDVVAFFVRLSAGPMDYTPGAMDNYRIGEYGGDKRNPGSLGTRSRQMAMMTLYEAPLQMLCDAPTKYEKNAECFTFMAKTPVVWDDTVGLGGSPDTFAAVARRKGNVWHAAAITNREGRDFSFTPTFLGDGNWVVEIFRDADDADVNPTHFVHENGKTVRAEDPMSFHMSPGGGFVVRFSKEGLKR